MFVGTPITRVVSKTLENVKSYISALLRTFCFHFSNALFQVFQF